VILFQNFLSNAEKEESSMRNPNKPIPVIDERPKGRKGIAEMIDRMLKTDEDGNPENKEDEHKKIIA
jgi:hypothetical protein